MVEYLPQEGWLRSVIGHVPRVLVGGLQREPDPTLGGGELPGRVASLLILFLAPDLYKIV